MNDRSIFRYVFKDEDDEIIIEHHNLDLIERGTLSWLHDRLQCWTLVARDQCTGLKDKNGQLIFEGDFVKWWDAFRLGKGVVIFAEYSLTNSFHGYGFAVKQNNNETHAFASCCDYRIIGNIHENGDLLN